LRNARQKRSNLLKLRDVCYLKLRDVSYSQRSYEGNVNKKEHCSIPNLMQEMTVFIKAISDDLCKPVIQNLAMRIRECILCHGDLIELAIFTA